MGCDNAVQTTYSSGNLLLRGDLCTHAPGIDGESSWFVVSFVVLFTGLCLAVEGEDQAFQQVPITSSFLPLMIRFCRVAAAWSTAGRTALSLVRQMPGWSSLHTLSLRGTVKAGGLPTHICRARSFRSCRPAVMQPAATEGSRWSGLLADGKGLVTLLRKSCEERWWVLHKMAQT